MHQDTRLRALHRHANIADAFAAWLHDHANDLLDAVGLLGGRRWVARTEALIRAIRKGRAPSDHLVDLKAVSRLLHLDYSDRPGSEEELRFTEIHPDDPRADNARVCAEALDRGITAIEGLQRTAVIRLREAV